MGVVLGCWAYVLPGLSTISREAMATAVTNSEHVESRRTTSHRELDTTMKNACVFSSWNLKGKGTTRNTETPC